MHHLLAALLLAAEPGVDPKLVGTWSLDGQPFMVLNADGTGRMDEGNVRWTAALGILSIIALDGTADRVRYRLKGETLTLQHGETPVDLVRVGGASPAPSSREQWEGAAPRAATGAATGTATGAAPGTAPGSAPPAKRAAGTGGMAATAATGGTAGSSATGRAIRFNGRALDAAQLQTFARIEQAIGRIPDGDYWYDPRSGASGRWGGPALAFLPAGLDLGGALPANASGGGQGQLTGVFVNGRELHPIDIAGLQELVGAVMPGRWWVDASANYGLEGGPPLGNLVAIAQQRRAAGGKGGRAWSKHYEGVTPRDNLNMASDGNTTCVSVSGYSRCTGE
jgi:hypothetical protein